jgi:hypothetical protein
VSVFSEEQSHELGMNRRIVSEIPSEETADEVAVDRSIITWEMYIFQRAENALQIGAELFHLSGFAGSVKALEYCQHNCLIISLSYLCKDR